MNILIEGRRGLGKSTLAQFLAEQLNKSVLVFDANNQFKNSQIRTSDIERVEEELEMHNPEKHFSLSYVPQGNVEEEWDVFANLIWNYGDYSLIVDEAHRLQKPQYVNPWLDKFMRQAPRRERNDDSPIDIIQTFHRPTDVNGIVTSLADKIYIFRQTKKRDLENLEKEYGEEVAQAVKTLATPQTTPAGRDVLIFTVDTDSYVVLHDSKEWFVNIRKPEN